MVAPSSSSTSSLKVGSSSIFSETVSHHHSNEGCFSIFGEARSSGRRRRRDDDDDDESSSTSSSSPTPSAPPTTSTLTTFIDNKQNINDINNNTKQKNKNKKQPHHHHTIDDAELARELNQLSVQEREKIYEEIHGVNFLQTETLEFQQNVIDELDVAISKLSRSRRTIVEKAFFLKPSLEHDTNFKLLFLRADYYDASKAAKRLAQYFLDKQKVFGPDKLVKKITLDDLEEEDLELFSTGLFLLLPHKDRSGRPIWFCDVSKYDFSKAKSMTRCAWYMIMSSSELEEAQLKGVSCICHCLRSFTLNVALPKFYDIMVTSGEMLTNLPVRPTSFHFCYNNRAMAYMLSAFRSSFGKFTRLRLRPHFGSEVEIQYSLLTYGIRCPFLTNPDGDTEQLDLLQLYMDRRRRQESQEVLQEQEESKRLGIFLQPNPNDVLVGRGYCYQMFHGNQMLSSLIDEQYIQRHLLSGKDRFEKTCIHMEVVKTFQEYSNGGRFLIRTKDGWKIVDDKIARKKVCSAFRSKTAKLPATTTMATSAIALVKPTTGSSFSSSSKTGAAVLASPPVAMEDDSFVLQDPYDVSTVGGAGGGGSKRIRYDPSLVMSEVG